METFLNAEIRSRLALLAQTGGFFGLERIE